MELFEAIRQRRSYRGDVTSQPIPDDVVDQLIEAAMWAPSPFNVQPWEWILIRDGALKSELARITAQSIQQQFKDPRFLDANSRWMRLTREAWERAGDGVLLEEHVSLPSFVKHPEHLRPFLKHARHLSFLGHLGAGKPAARAFANWLEASPLLILVLIDWRRQCPGEGGRDWMMLGMGAMLENFWLAATALGLAVQLISAPLESPDDRQRVRETVSAPKPLEPIALLRLGYAEPTSQTSAQGSVRRRNFVHREKWTRSSRR